MRSNCYSRYVNHLFIILFKYCVPFINQQKHLILHVVSFLKNVTCMFVSPEAHLYYGKSSYIYFYARICNIMFIYSRQILYKHELKYKNFVFFIFGVCVCGGWGKRGCLSTSVCLHYFACINLYSMIKLQHIMVFYDIFLHFSN